jgi:hypothetical protein
MVFKAAIPEMALVPDFENQGGRLIPVNTAYNSDIANQDWDPTGTSHPRVNHTITDGKTCAEIRASFQDTHRRLQSADIKWQMAGPNSNSYIYTMLVRAGLIEHFPLSRLRQELPFSAANSHPWP